MRHLRVLVTLAALVACLPASAQPPRQGFDRDRVRDRDTALNDVLEEIRTEHPELWQRLEAALGDSPSRGRWRLSRQARYLRERADAERHDPETFALLVRQEAMEERVRDLVGLYRGADADAPQRETTANELRAVLGEWFDIRQALRLRRLDRFEQDFEAQRERVEATAADPLAATESWAARITEGGPEAMRRRLAGYERADDLEPLAPALFRYIARRDPSSRREIARLADEDPEAIRAQLERIAAEHPEAVAEARRQWADTLALHADLREAQRVATEAALAGNDERLMRALNAVVQADLAIARHNLDRVRRDLERKQRWFNERVTNRATIIELQLARLLDQGDRFEW